MSMSINDTHLYLMSQRNTHYTSLRVSNIVMGGIFVLQSTIVLQLCFLRGMIQWYTALGVNELRIQSLLARDRIGKEEGWLRKVLYVIFCSLYEDNSPKLFRVSNTLSGKCSACLLHFTIEINGLLVHKDTFKSEREDRTIDHV